MNTKFKFTLALLLTATTLPAQTTQLKIATISAGAARLDNGSLVNIGQPFVGVMSASGGETFNTGLIPAVQSGGVAVAKPSFYSVPAFDGSSLRLTLFSQPGIAYVLQASTNLVDWVSLSTNKSIGVTVTLQDSNSTVFPYRFYRVWIP